MPAPRRRRHPALTAAVRLALTVLMPSIAPAMAQGYDGTCATPEEVAALPPGHWCEVPDSHLKDAAKRPQDHADYDPATGTSRAFESYQRVGGVNYITKWSGGVMDTARNRLVVFGGGHNDYGGNELYAFDLDTLAWERLTDPTPFPRRWDDEGGRFIQNDDGTPISRHTYSGLAYIAHAGKLFAFGGAPDSAIGGCGVDGTWTYDLAGDGGWTLVARHPEAPTTRCEDNAVYDPDSGLVFYLSKDIPHHAFDVDSGTWKRIGSPTKNTHNQTLAHVPPLRAFAVTGYDGRVVLLDPADGLAAKTLPTSGATEIEDMKNPGLAWDPVAERLIAWRRGGTVYSLDVGTGEWTKHTPPPTNRTTPPEKVDGVYGEFAYSQPSNVFIYFDRPFHNVWLYRHAAR